MSNSRLSYRGKFTPNLIQAINEYNDCLDIDNQIQFPDMTTRIPLIVEWSQEEFTEIASAVLNGALQAVPDNYMDVFSTFFRIIGCPVDICDLVADCIESNPSVATALANLIATNSMVQSGISTAVQITNQYGGDSNWNNSLPASILDASRIPDDALCTDANKYAMSLAIVRALDTLTNDFLEIIEVLTNPNEIAGDLVKTVPIFGGAASLAFDTAAWLQDNISEVYNAAYNSATEQNIACHIYCNFNDCDLSYNDILQSYYEVGSFTPPNTDDFLVIMDWLITEVIPSTDDVIVGAMHTMILYCLQWGSNWVGSAGFTLLDIEIENAKDEEVTVPEECECGPSYNAYYIDFTSELGDWIIQFGNQTANGIESVSAGQPESINVYIQDTVAWIPDGIRVVYQRQSDGSALDDLRVNQYTAYPAGTGLQVWFEYNEPTHSDMLIDHCHEDSAVANRQALLVSLRDNNAGSDIILKSIMVYPPPPSSAANAIWSCA